MQSRLRYRETGLTRYDEQAISGWDPYIFVYGALQAGRLDTKAP